MGQKPRQNQPRYVMTSLARGVERVWHYEIDRASGDIFFQRVPGSFGGHAPKTAHFATEEEAQGRANKLRFNRIASLRRQLTAEEERVGKPVPVTDIG